MYAEPDPYDQEKVAEERAAVTAEVQAALKVGMLFSAALLM